MRRGIDRRARFIDNDLGRGQGREAFKHLPGKVIGFTRKCAVANRDQLDLMARGKGGHGVNRALHIIARLERIDRRGIDQFARRIDHGNLDPGTHARIKTHGGLLPGRSGQKKVFEVIGKDLDRIFFSAVTQRPKQIKLNRQ